MGPSVDRLRSELPVVALFGPTGVGKTAVAIALAGLLSREGLACEAVSADAMQVYKGLEVLTGAASQAEQAGLRHHMVSVVEVDQVFDVVQFAQMAHSAIDRLRKAGKLPIVVGGTGLYLRAALCDLDFLPPPLPGLREQLEGDLEKLGAAGLYERLASIDPVTAKTIDAANGRRIVRALEAHAAGRSSAQRVTNRLWTQDVRLPTRLFGLTMERSDLYAAIEARIDRMVEEGAAAEVERARDAGISRTARQVLGYDELLAGDLDAMKQNTRRYAKRQLTWLRKLPSRELVDVTGRTSDEVAHQLLGELLGD